MQDRSEKLGSVDPSGSLAKWLQLLGDGFSVLTALTNPVTVVNAGPGTHTDLV